MSSLGFSVLEDDDDLFDVGGDSSSKLSSLFNDKKSSREKSPLTYTAPKDPSKEKQVKEQQPSVVHAVAVRAYQYEGNQATTIGKVGAAVVGTSSTFTYHLLLYLGSNKQTISSTSITPQFTLQIPSANYIFFYDDKGKRWSLMFDTVTDLKKFTKQVAVCRARSYGANGLKDIIFQTVSPGSTSDVVEENEYDVTYEIYPLVEHTAREAVQSSTETVRIRDSSLKVWREGLKGMKEDEERVLILPAQHGHGVAGAPEDVLLYDVKLVKIKPKLPLKDKPTLLTTDSYNDKVAESHQGSRSEDASINTNEVPVDKAKLISRMAKMGHTVLPNLNQCLNSSAGDSQKCASSKSAESSSEELEQECPVPAARRRKPKTRKDKVEHKFVERGNQEQHLPENYVQPLSRYANTQPPILHSVLGSSSPTSFPDPQLPLFMSQNSELRMLMLRVSDRVDQLFSKVASALAEKQKSPSTTPFSTTAAMEPSTLLCSISKLVKENEVLQMENKEKSERLEKQTSQIMGLLDHMPLKNEVSSLHEENSRLKEDILRAQIEKRETTKLEEALLKLQKENESLLLEKQQITLKIKTLEEEVERLKTVEREQERAIVRLKENLEQLENELSKAEGVNETVNCLQERLKNRETALENMRTKLEQQVLQGETAMSEKSKSEAQVTTLKQVVQKLKEKVQNVESESAWNEIKRLEMQVATLKETIVKLNQKLLTKADKRDLIESGTADIVVREVKRILNSVFHKLQMEFRLDQSYTGKDVQQTVLRVVRLMTLQVLEEYTAEAKKNRVQKNIMQPSDGKMPQKEKMNDVSEKEMKSNKDIEKNDAGKSDDDCQKKEDVERIVIRKSEDEEKGDYAKPEGVEDNFIEKSEVEESNVSRESQDIENENKGTTDIVESEDPVKSESVEKDNESSQENKEKDVGVKVSGTHLTEDPSQLSKSLDATNTVTPLEATNSCETGSSFQATNPLETLAPVRVSNSHEATSPQLSTNVHGPAKDHQLRNAPEPTKEFELDQSVELDTPLELPKPPEPARRKVVPKPLKESDDSGNSEHDVCKAQQPLPQPAKRKQENHPLMSHGDEWDDEMNHQQQSNSDNISQGKETETVKASKAEGEEEKKRSEATKEQVAAAPKEPVKTWKPQPPPLLFGDSDDDDDDWLN